MKTLFKKSNPEAGFTLIELLVVIAIIAILSTIVLASLAAARSRAQVAKITSQMAQIPAAIELAANSGSYTAPTTQGTCAGNMWSDTSSGIVKLTTVASYPGGTAVNCYGDAGSYAVSVTSTASGSSVTYCVDLAGVKNPGTATTTSPYKCN